MSLLNMSFSASILILVIVIIRALLLHRLPKRTFLVLWGAVLCRLLVPFEISSRFSIYSIANTLTSRVFETDFPISGSPAMQNNAAVTEIAETLPEATFTNVSPFMVIWFIGLVVCALFFLVTHLRCRKEYKTALPIDNELLRLWQQEHPMRRSVQIRQSDRIAAPLTYGIFRPVVLLSKQTDWTDEIRLRYILAHEFVHIRRFDTLTKLVIVDLRKCISRILSLFVIYFLHSKKGRL